jgi:putative tricarboxylic transport membrane protein
MMYRYQRFLNVIWIVLGVSVAVYASRLGVWQPGGPSIGFMPLAAGTLIATLGALQIFLSEHVVDNAEASFFPSRDALRRVFSVIATLVAIALLMQPLGFLLTAFLAMVFLLTIIECRGWLSTIAIALGASVGVWWLFTRLDVILPRGPFGF